MTYVFRWRKIVVALALVAAPGCKPDSSKRADKSAERVIDKQNDLRTQRMELGDKKVDEVNKTATVDKTAGDLALANEDFVMRRDLRAKSLRGVHALIATQPMLISTMAQAFPLTDAGRADVDAKLQAFQAELDQTGNMIEGLAVADAESFKKQDDAVSKAMGRLDDARKDAWKALQDAPRTDRSS